MLIDFLTLHDQPATPRSPIPQHSSSVEVKIALYKLKQCIHTAAKRAHTNLKCTCNILYARLYRKHSRQWGFYVFPDFIMRLNNNGLMSTGATGIENAPSAYKMCASSCQVEELKCDNRDMEINVVCIFKK